MTVEQIRIIQDNLNYLVGCEFSNGKDIRKLLGFSIHGETVNLYFRPNGRGYIEQLCTTNARKPILKKLSCMTDDEAIEIAKIADTWYHSEVFGITPSVERDNYGIRVKLHIKCQVDPLGKASNTVLIQNDFNLRLLFAAETEQECDLPVDNQKLVFDYFIKRQFDIFGLIEQGAALTSK